jgi:hypothetical protein
VEYAIPKHIKNFFQLVGTNNNEFEAKECTSNDDSFLEDDWVDGFEWINISLRCEECDYDEEWMECETM